MNTDVPTESQFVRILKSLSVTRWACHYEAVKGIDQEILRIIKVLFKLTMESDPKTSANARSLLVAVLDAEFIIGISILKIILPNTSKLNTYVQSPSIDIRKLRVAAEGTITTLEGCRTDKDYDLVWESFEHRCEEIKKFVEEENIEADFKELKLPRKLPEGVTDTKSYQRMFSYYPSFDRIISELKRRFAENDKDNLCSLGAIVFDDEPQYSDIEKVAEFYGLDKELLSNDIKFYLHFKGKLIPPHSSASEILQLFLSNEVLKMMPELSKALRILSVIPATSCSAERSFSSLRRLKSYLRSTMGQERLSSLALLHIEREYVNKVMSEDINKLIDTFGSSKGRNKYFF